MISQREWPQPSSTTCKKGVIELQLERWGDGYGLNGAGPWDHSEFLFGTSTQDQHLFFWVIIHHSFGKFWVITFFDIFWQLCWCEQQSTREPRHQIFGPKLLATEISAHLAGSKWGSKWAQLWKFLNCWDSFRDSERPGWTRPIHSDFHPIYPPNSMKLHEDSSKSSSSEDEDGRKWMAIEMGATDATRFLRFSKGGPGHILRIPSWCSRYLCTFWER